MDQIDPKNSKCWSCKHGLCVGETNFMSHHSHSKPELTNRPFGDVEGFDEEEEDEIIEHLIPVSNIKGLCFYQEKYPLLVGFVEECNRYESKT